MTHNLKVVSSAQRALRESPCILYRMHFIYFPIHKYSILYKNKSVSRLSSQGVCIPRSSFLNARLRNGNGRSNNRAPEKIQALLLYTVYRFRFHSSLQIFPPVCTFCRFCGRPTDKNQSFRARTNARPRGNCPLCSPGPRVAAQTCTTISFLAPSKLS